MQSTAFRAIVQLACAAKLVFWKTLELGAGAEKREVARQQVASYRFLLTNASFQVGR
jgi:hypothetical protein